MTLDRESLTENELEEAKRIALEIARLKRETEEAMEAKGDSYSLGRVIGYPIGILALLIWIWLVLVASCKGSRRCTG